MDNKYLKGNMPSPCTRDGHHLSVQLSLCMLSVRFALVDELIFTGHSWQKCIAKNDGELAIVFYTTIAVADTSPPRPERICNSLHSTDGLENITSIVTMAFNDC